MGRRVTLTLSSFSPCIVPRKIPERRGKSTGMPLKQSDEQNNRHGYSSWPCSPSATSCGGVSCGDAASGVLACVWADHRKGTVGGAPPQGSWYGGATPCGCGASCGGAGFGFTACGVGPCAGVDTCEGAWQGGRGDSCQGVAYHFDATSCVGGDGDNSCLRLRRLRLLRQTCSPRGVQLIRGGECNGGGHRRGRDHEGGGRDCVELTGSRREDEWLPKGACLRLKKKEIR